MSQNESLDNYRIGRMACEAGWMTVDQLGRCLQLQRESAEQGGRLKFGEVAVAEGYLTKQQVESLLKLQALHRPPEYDQAFGSLAVREGYVTQDDIDLCLIEQQRALRLGRKPPTLGSMLVDRGVLTLEQLRDVLRRQSVRGRQAPENLERLSKTGGVTRAPEEPAASDEAEDAPRATRYETADRSYGPAVDDGRLGRMALVAGWMTTAQVYACLERQKWNARREDRTQRFGEVAVEKGFLTEDQVNALLRIQTIHRPAEYDKTFGAMAVRLGLATQEQVDTCLRHQVRLLEANHEAPMLGLLMIEMRVLTPAQVQQVVRRQAGSGQGPFALFQRAGGPNKPLVQKIREGARRRLSRWTRKH